MSYPSNFRYRNQWRPYTRVTSRNRYQNELINAREEEDTDWHTVSSNLDEDEEPYEGGPLNMKGFMYFPKTRKYFKISDQHAMNGFSRFEINNRRRKNREVKKCVDTVKNKEVRQLANILRDVEIGMNRQNSDRLLDELRLVKCTPKPSFSIRTPVDDLGKVLGCEFLDVSETGEKIIGCFSIGDQSPSSTQRLYSNLCVMDSYCIDDYASKECARRDSDDETKFGFNTLGIQLKQTENDDDIDQPSGSYNNSIFRFDDVLVDQTIAKVDRDVTCILTVTASDSLNNTTGVVQSSCSVNLTPLLDFSDPECGSSITSPIYNKQWRNRGHIWSVGWNSPEMSIGFGMEDRLRIENILTNRSVMLSSRKRNVISHCFSNDGKHVYMGLRGDDVIRSDLRMNRDHITGHLTGSKSTAYVKVLREFHSDCLITENFGGKLRLWDFRWPKKELLLFEGHQNLHYRLPCFVDPEEKFVFATGSDGITRGWSLSSGELLCSVKSPRPDNGPLTDFPRIVYSNQWGGRVGNSALILAVGGMMRVHILDFY